MKWFTLMPLREGEDGGAPAPAPAPALAPQPWYHGAEPDLVGHIQNRGWDKKSEKEVALEAAKSHREAERLIGVPADQIVRLPKDANDPAWKQVFNRVNGTPLDPKEYDFSTIKDAAGQPIPQAFADTLRKAAATFNLGKDAAAGVAAEVQKFFDGVEAAKATEYQAKITTEKEALAKEWGANFEAQMFIARQAATKIGFTPEEISVMEKAAGYTAVMKRMNDLGKKLGEDKFVQGGGPNNNNLMTKEQATAKKNELMQDKAFVNRYNSGDTAAYKEMQALDIILSA